MDRQNNSANEIVLEYLQTNDYLTTKEASCELGVTRLANCISELRKQGIPILDVWEKGINRYGKPCRFKKYFLPFYEENNE